MSYRWIITEDLVADHDWPEGTNGNAKGVVGPRHADESITDNKTAFRMHDDDGECYYKGYIFGDFDGFEPLDDFGMPNAGCTKIWIWGAWL